MDSPDVIASQGSSYFFATKESRSIFQQFVDAYSREKKSDIYNKYGKNITRFSKISTCHSFIIRTTLSNFSFKTCDLLSFFLI